MQSESSILDPSPDDRIGAAMASLVRLLARSAARKAAQDSTHEEEPVDERDQQTDPDQTG